MLIRFTLESGDSLPFLDVRFTLKPDNSFDTDIYYKETDSHNFVPFFSFHPRKTLTNIPYSLARRICTIVSDPYKCDERLHELAFFLSRKQYPHGIIWNGIERAKAIARDSLLHPQITSTQDQNLPFVFTNNSSNPQVLDIVRQSTHLLVPSKRMGAVMSNRKIVAARRQPPSLKTHLFRPRFESKPQDSNPGSVTACRNVPNRKPTRGQPCRCCDAINECSSFQFSANEIFELRWHFTCDSMNLLYVLTCSGCDAYYIGQTERTVRERCGDYRRAVSDEKYHTQGVHRHIAQCGKGRFQITPFFKIKSNDRGHTTILTYESQFIKKYKPALNESKL